MAPQRPRSSQGRKQEQIGLILHPDQSVRGQLSQLPTKTALFFPARGLAAGCSEGASRRSPSRAVLVGSYPLTASCRSAVQDGLEAEERSTPWRRSRTARGGAGAHLQAQRGPTRSAGADAPSVDLEVLRPRVRPKGIKPAVEGGPAETRAAISVTGRP